MGLLKDVVSYFKDKDDDLNPSKEIPQETRSLKNNFSGYFKELNEFKTAVIEGDVVEVERRMGEYIGKPQGELDHLFELAVKTGQKEVEDLLMPVCDENMVLNAYVKYNKVDQVKEQIKECNPDRFNSMALCLAAENGHKECVELLMPASCQIYGARLALLAAVKGGHEEVADLIIKKYDISEIDLNDEMFNSKYNASFIDAANEMVIKKRIDDMKESIGFEALQEQAPTRKRRM